MDPITQDDNHLVLNEVKDPKDELLELLIKAFNLVHSGDSTLNERLCERMKLGFQRYGHGMRIGDDTRQWGTRENSWLEMCEEEILDGIVYVAAHNLRSR
jgi:hypothetical protein